MSSTTFGIIFDQKRTDIQSANTLPELSTAVDNLTASELQKYKDIIEQKAYELGTPKTFNEVQSILNKISSSSP